MSRVKPAPLPDVLAGGAFRTADARAAGVPPQRLRRSDVSQVTQGVWAARSLRPGVDALGAVALALPDGAAFSHLTAARLHGLWLPETAAGSTSVEVTTPQRTQIRRPGWIAHRGIESRRLVTVAGLPVTSLEDTWCDLGSLAVGRAPVMTMDDVVVLGDDVANRLVAGLKAAAWMAGTASASGVDPSAAIALLDGTLDRRPGIRGRRALLAALPHVRAGSRSPQESRARIMFVRAGFPEPSMNPAVLAPEGSWLAEGDLVWAAARVLVEYQSAFHADRRRRSADAARQRLLHDHGWTVHEMWAEDLVPGPRRRGFLARVGRSLGLDPRGLSIE